MRIYDLRNKKAKLAVCQWYQRIEGNLRYFTKFAKDLFSEVDVSIELYYQLEKL